MLGYKFEDIQKMGEALHNATEIYTHLIRDKDTLNGLLEIHNFFEGLLVEGYIEDEEVA